MVRILATDGMEKGAVHELEKRGFEVVQQFYEPEELKEKVKEFDVLVVRSATKVREPVIDAALETGRLKMIIRGGVGIDNIDAKYAEENGIKVCNTPNASSASVAELAIAHIFSVARQVAFANVTMKQGLWEKKVCKGTEISGKTLGLIGMGRIGRETAKRASALGMTVIYTNQSGPKTENSPYLWVSMDELLAKADFISLHIPAKKGSSPIINKDSISKMKDGVFIINTARGTLIDEAALIEALDSGKVAGVGLDVYQEEPTKNVALYCHKKVSCTPHIGASTGEAQKRVGEETVKHILSIFE